MAFERYLNNQRTSPGLARDMADWLEIMLGFEN